VERVRCDLRRIVRVPVSLVWRVSLRRLLLVSAVVCTIVSGAWAFTVWYSTLPSADVRCACEMAKASLDLADDIVGQCLQDEPFRNELHGRYNPLRAVRIAALHDEGRTRLRLRGFPRETFTRVRTTAALPDADRLDAAAGTKYIGKRYVLRARVSARAFLPAVDDASDAGESRRVGRQALTAHQEQFLQTWCTGYPSTCHGDVYLEIARGPSGSRISMDLVGAEVDPADPKTLFAELHRESPMWPKKPRGLNWVNLMTDRSEPPARRDRRPAPTRPDGS
jgi:hypothetical protein